MPPRTVRGGWKNPGTKNKPLSKKKAMAQHKAIKANKNKLAKGGIIRKKKRRVY